MQRESDVSIATVVTRGYGSFGSIADVVTRGFTAATAAPTPTPTPTPAADATGRTYGGVIDYDERKQIAAEFREIYADLYERKEQLSPDEIEIVAESVSEYAPVNAPDMPVPAVIDWGGMVEQQERLVLLVEQFKMLQRALDDEEDDLTVLLLL